MANTVSFIIQLQDRFSRKANKISESVRRATSKFDGFSRKIRKANDKLVKFGKAAKRAGGKLRDFGKKLTLSVTLPLSIMGGVALVQSAKLETLAVAFETMTGSAEKGQALLKQLTKFTATTPFQLEGVAKATKTLLAFKVPLEGIPGTLRMLGDIAAGTDAPLSDIAQIFGKTRAKGKLMTEELLQFAERGIPIIDILAERLKVTKPVIFKLASESKISFGIMEEALKTMTSEGGIFFDQTIRQSKTLGGVWSTLRDNMGLTAGVFGDIIVDVFELKGGLKVVSDFLDRLGQSTKVFAKTHPNITKVLVILVAVLAVLGPLIISIGFLVVGFAAISVAAGFLGVSLSAISIPILIIIGAIAALVVAGIFLMRNWEKVKAVFKSVLDFILGGFAATVSLFTSVKVSGSELFSGLLESMFELGAGVIKFLINPLQGVIDLFSSLKSSVSSFIFGKNEIEQAKASIEATVNANPPAKLKSQRPDVARSQTDIGITLRAPENVVQSTEVRSSGNRENLNVGLNMVPAGA